MQLSNTSFFRRSSEQGLRVDPVVYSVVYQVGVSLPELKHDERGGRRKAEKKGKGEEKRGSGREQVVAGGREGGREQARGTAESENKDFIS